MIFADCASLHWEMVPEFSLTRTDFSDTWLCLPRGPCVCKKEERGAFYKGLWRWGGDVVWGSGTSRPSCFSLGSVSPGEGSGEGVGKGLCFLLPGSSAEIPFFLLPVLCWVFLVFSALLVRFMVVMLVMVLVVVMVSPHPMGPSGCREVREDKEVAKGGERRVA